MNPLTWFAFLLISLQCQGLPLLRIIGGEIAHDGQYPYMVALKTNNSQERFTCGGVIVSDRWILTAAHCLNKTKHPESFRILVGTNNLSTGGKYYNVSVSIAHENFTKQTKDFDIGLLKTEEQIEYNDKVQPIKLASRHPIESNGTHVKLAGWGKIKMKGVDRFPSELRHLNLTLYDHKKCQKIFKRLTENQICAFTSEGQGACKGDSGSALVYNEEVYGLTSYLKLPCAKGLPDVYTNVYRLLDWIKEKSNNEIPTEINSATESDEINTTELSINTTEIFEDATETTSISTDSTSISTQMFQ